jgi:hypothetical protein
MPETATVTLPETVTITSSQALDIIGLISAYASVCGNFTAEADNDPFYHVNNDAFVRTRWSEFSGFRKSEIRARRVASS